MKKKGNSQNGKISQIGKSVNNSSEKRLNPLRKTRNTFSVINHGPLCVKILIGLYYLGKAQLCELKDLGHYQQHVHRRAQLLVAKGLIEREGYRYSLTETGRFEVEPLIMFFKTAVPVS